MPRPFLQLTIDEFEELVSRFNFTRQITAVHVHHTWRPRHSGFSGLRTIEAMWRVHTEERGFSDIAQHITIAPDGSVWTGRAWNNPPASAFGHNGTSLAGPFMFEMIGDFDTGQDRLGGDQRRNALRVTAALQRRFGVNNVSVRFHRQLDNRKSCPGTAVDFDQFFTELAQLHERPRSAPAETFSDEGPIDASRRVSSGAVRDRIIVQAQQALSVPGDARSAADGELPENVEAPGEIGIEQPSFQPRGGLTPDQLRKLRPHVINMRNGELAESGIYTTLPQDLHDLVAIHLKQAYDAAEAENRPLRVVFYAHGGLVSEEAGLGQAAGDIGWWKANGIYPIYFVWETGLFETIGHLLRGTAPAAAARGFISDRITDPILERLARRLGGEKIWSGMKHNAALCSQPAGGAHQFARLFAEFCRNRTVEVHAVGHSAGAIFQAEYLPALLNLGSPPVKTLHLMAPAIRVDAFRNKLLNLMGNGIGFTTMYTMWREFELDDHCAHVYRKSLLYLIYHSFEPAPKTDLLGLEISVKNDPALRKAFALDGSEPDLGQVLFSKTPDVTGDNASQATSHPGFDNDDATMNSIALRILGRHRTEELEQPYPKSRSLDSWAEDPFDSVADELPRAIVNTPPVTILPTRGTDENAVFSTSPSAGTRSGNKRALCVGINNYVRQPLEGCVPDATLWAATLRSLDFEVTMLTDRAATLDGIRSAFTDLVRSGNPGDVLVFQFSGHGTRIDDVSGDDPDGKDEAICPVDFHTNVPLSDDEIGTIIDQVQPGVNLTMFIDCCHSGDISRFAVGRAAVPSAGARPRRIKLTREEQQRYREYKQGRSFSRSSAGERSKQEVLFSACRPTELAFERDLQGDFTRHGVAILRGGIAGITNATFAARVLDAFGESPRQHPELTCVNSLRKGGLLAPVATASPSAGSPHRVPSGNTALATVLAAGFERISQDLRKL